MSNINFIGKALNSLKAIWLNRLNTKNASILTLLLTSACAGEWVEPVTLVPATWNMYDLINPNDFPFYYYMMSLRWGDAWCMRVEKDITVYRYIVRNCVVQREEDLWKHYMYKYYDMCSYYWRKIHIPRKFRPIYETVFKKPYKKDL